ncbi:hypothetical protein LH23_13915 [Cedecea neteri]|uniref:DUF4062 domain-containing protein n=1 Tax=Cedecea neteri TaxID=158822 RepID=A0AAN0S594_9ENTR|nr:DUF4062 domain-containing protein [Cedecea neteri]AIR61711.1 hypothetical protein LH23_13915 [Cedecea neteri]
MDKRYQVFVSSTFTDLQEERSNVIQALMEMDCIPAGMALFPSIDVEQWTFIQKVIDDSDYYLLIIGGRYGTLAEDGLSYTEKEFDYAISKGLKVVVLVHEDPDALPLAKSEKEPALREKLQQFIEKASSGRLRKTWVSAKDLPGIVALSLNKTIKSYPAIGWVRADKASNERTLYELNELRKKNEELLEKVEELNNLSNVMSLDNLAFFDDIYELPYEISSFNWADSSVVKEKKIMDIKWMYLFSIISPFLIEESTDHNVHEIIKKHIERYLPHSYTHTTIDAQDIKTIYIQFKALGLLEYNDVSWKLTSKGSKLMMQLRTIKNNE